MTIFSLFFTQEMEMFAIFAPLLAIFLWILPGGDALSPLVVVANKSLSQKGGFRLDKVALENLLNSPNVANKNVFIFSASDEC